VGFASPGCAVVVVVAITLVVIVAITLVVIVAIALVAAVVVVVVVFSLLSLPGAGLFRFCQMG